MKLGNDVFLFYEVAKFILKFALLDSKIKRNKPPQTYIDARYLI